MRSLKFFALVSTFLLCCVALPPARSASCHQASLNPASNYVVIGAFAVHDNAVRFTSHAQGMKFDAQYMMNPNRNLYYVYVLNTEDRSQAIGEARRLREQTEFSDAWVYGGLLGTDLPGEDINPITSETIGTVRTDQAAGITAVDAPAQTIAAPTEATSEPKDEATEDAALGNPFLFSLYRESDNEKVDGDVVVVDAERSRKLASYKGNAPVRISAPDNASGNLSLIVEVFGYRKVQRDINYHEPLSDDITKDEDGNVVVPFQLMRLKKGDVAIMYNVYFFKDAGVMRPESRFEVNSLLAMLKENPQYKIKLHGHTNGNATGKIISMGKSKNFFTLNDTREGFGSAKKLSLERAEVIREYLINEGIEPSRMELKAWGGKRPIHQKNSPRAQENVRVEVEILED